MSTQDQISRRKVLGAFAAAPFVVSAANGKRVPIGLELYSVRNQLKDNLTDTLQAVAKMGYECVEFFAPYHEWTPDYAKQVRKQLDDLKVRCYSTHNDHSQFNPDSIAHAIELNKILGTRYVVMASPGKVSGLDDWKHIAEVLNQANEKFASVGLHAGYHNHDAEWKPVNAQMPLEIIAANTDKSIVLQLDVGTCVATGNDPVAWIDKNPGRIKSMHLKDWSPEKGYHVLFGEGVAPWKKIFAAAESTGGIEYYLMEQEGSEYPELETADRCLIAYHHLQG